MRFDETMDEQSVQIEVEQMGLASLSRYSAQQPVIDFPIVDDSDSDHEDDDGDVDGHYGFFFDIVSNPGEPERHNHDHDTTTDSSDDAWSDTWSNASSTSDEVYYWIDRFGGWYFDLSSWRYEPMYKFVEPDPGTSCNAAAAALKEPLSLLTKYRRQRLSHQSKYFQSSIPSPSKALCQARQVRCGSRLKKVRNVDDKTVRWA